MKIKATLNLIQLFVVNTNFFYFSYIQIMVILSSDYSFVTQCTSLIFLYYNDKPFSVNF